MTIETIRCDRCFTLHDTEEGYFEFISPKGTKIQLCKRCSDKFEDFMREGK